MGLHISGHNVFRVITVALIIITSQITTIPVAPSSTILLASIVVQPCLMSVRTVMTVIAVITTTVHMIIKLSLPTPTVLLPIQPLVDAHTGTQLITQLIISAVFTIVTLAMELNTIRLIVVITRAQIIHKTAPISTLMPNIHPLLLSQRQEYASTIIASTITLTSLPTRTAPMFHLSTPTTVITSTLQLKHKSVARPLLSSHVITTSVM
jgi:hypothetical protein